MTETGLFKRFRDSLLFLSLCLFPSASAFAELEIHAELSSAQVVDGSIVLITVKTPAPDPKITGTFEESEFSFFASPDRGEGTYEGVMAIPFNHKSGETKVTIHASAGTDVKNEELTFNIVDGNYPSEALKVDERRVNPRKKDMKRIKREIKEVHKIYAISTPHKFWKGPFELPIQSDVTSQFGTKRMLNGEMQTFHRGLDLRAKVGTPIHSAAPGKVVLAKSLFFTGNTVLVDHGYGIYTLYAHMSRIKVKLGQEITDHKLIGLSGKTGRVSGPHLHWGAIVQRTQVNPMDLTRVMQ